MLLAAALAALAWANADADSYDSFWRATRLSKRRLQPPVGWASVAGGGTIAGIRFTVSLLAAALAFHGQQLDEAKVGILSAALAAAAITWLVFGATALLPRGRGSARCSAPPSRSSISTSTSIPAVTRSGGRSARRSRSSSTATSHVRIAGRRSPSSASCCATSPTFDTSGGTHVEPAAEALEAAAEQDAFCEMYDLLLAHQDALDFDDLIRYAAELELDADRFANDGRVRVGAERVADDVDSADLSGVSGTPTFFVNGQRGAASTTSRPCRRRCAPRARGPCSRRRD